MRISLSNNALGLENPIADKVTNQAKKSVRLKTFSFNKSV